MQRWAIVLCLLVACAKARGPKVEPSHQAAPQAEQVIIGVPTSPPVPELTFFGSPVADAEWLSSLAQAPIESFASVGHSSVALKTRLSDGRTVALRARTNESPRGWIAEIAAYRVAHVLGMDNVPPAGLRRITKRELHSKLRERGVDERIESRILWDTDGTAPCALTPWIDGLRDADLESTGTWMPWMRRGADVPNDKRALADDLARTIVFDYLIANIDRFSGGNMKVDESGSRLVARDHNLAFITPLPAIHEQALSERLSRIESVPPMFRTIVNSLDDTRWRQLLRDVDRVAGEPLLTEPQFAAFLERLHRVQAMR